MIIFRPHRGSLIGAMKDAKEFESEEDMIDYIFEDWQGWIRKEDIVISDRDIHDDNRINWKDVDYVCINGIMENDGTYRDYIKLHGTPQCIGMCSCNYTMKA